jgi:uncharacterized membrane protein
MSFRVVQVAAVVTYPLLVYSAMRWLEFGQAGLALFALYAAVFLLRARGSGSEFGGILRQHIGLLAVIGVATWLRDRHLLLLLPVLVNLYLLFTFGSTLVKGPPMIERFARVIEDDLPDFTHPYCRKVTFVWCGFFIANATLISYLAYFAPLEWWTLYTGLVFYLLLAALQGTEFVVRKLWFRYYQEGVVDRQLARLFPPERTSNGRRSLAYQATRIAASQPAALKAESL